LGEDKKARVAKFLKEFKRIAASGRGLDIIPRHENIDHNSFHRAIYPLCFPFRTKEGGDRK